MIILAIGSAITVFNSMLGDIKAHLNIIVEFNIQAIKIRNESKKFILLIILRELLVQRKKQVSNFSC